MSLITVCCVCCVQDGSDTDQCDIDDDAQGDIGDDAQMPQSARVQASHDDGEHAVAVPELKRIKHVRYTPGDIKAFLLGNGA